MEYWKIMTVHIAFVTLCLADAYTHIHTHFQLRKLNKIAQDIVLIINLVSDICILHTVHTKTFRNKDGQSFHISILFVILHDSSYKRVQSETQLMSNEV